MPTPTTVLIGEGLIPLRCAGILLEKSFDVIGVISSTRELHSWADKRGIANMRATGDIDAFLRVREPFDLLFSIVNSRILGTAALSIPRLAAVNFHNSLLPRFAGSNASSWAILERENFHGVTWHLMTPRADAGGIVKQACVPIETWDTAQTLDLKCTELALATFEELLSDLQGAIANATPQDLARRTFYGARRKPHNAGIISWRSSAEEIDRLVRALTVSPQVNRFASPLVALGDDYYVVAGLDVLEERSSKAPGTNIDHSVAGLRVATTTHDVNIRALWNLNGAVVEIAGLTRASTVPEVEADVVNLIEQAVRRSAPHEAFWALRLATLAPLELPCPRSASGDREQFREPMPWLNDVPSAAALLLAFLGRVAGIWSFDVGFSEGNPESPLWYRRFFAPYVPLRCDFDPSWTVEQAGAHIAERISQIRGAGTFTRDLCGRYSDLRTSGGPAWAMPIVVTIGDAGASPPSGTQLTIDISLEGKFATWRYDPRSLPTDLVQGLARGYAAFASHARSAPTALLSGLPSVDPAEREHLLVRWNPPPTPFPRTACMHQFVEVHAEQTPEAVAVALHSGDHQLTYRDLNQRANRWAHALRTLGVGPNIPVALILERSVELIVAALAVLKAGGAYVPLDASWPPQRLRMLLDDTNPPVVLTVEALAATLSVGDRAVLCVDRSTFNGQPSSNPEQRNTATDLASIMYTSGSTGEPKGVAVPHRAVVRLLVGTDYIPWSEKPTFLHLAPVAFDASFLEIWGPLLHGGTCVVYPGRVPDLQEIGRALERHRVSCLWLTASLFNLVIDQQPEILERVRHLVTGGEALSVRHVRLALERLPRTQLINGYGPTEGVTFTCCFPIPRPLPANLTSIPIGRPLANTRVYVLDEQKQLVPAGVPGELYIGGDGLALGYWNRPDLTAERFVPDPFAPEKDARMYRSGDRCRWLADGNLEFLGRLDDQVKLRGFRIEPGEIEALLSRHPAVRQCAVVVRAEKQLAAYIVLHAEPPSPQELGRYLAERLPEYMLPSAFVTLDALPLTGSGKVDRAALPAPLPVARAEDHAPATPLEADIAQVWKSVLGVPVGGDDNFCDLGGTSLSLIQVHSRLTADLHLELSIVDLFQHSTVRSLARHISQMRDNVPDVSLQGAIRQRAQQQRQAFEEKRRRVQ